MTAAVTTPTIAWPSLFGDVIRSEWTKIRTVRSTFWTLLAAVAAMIGLSVIASEVVVHQWSDVSAQDRVSFSPIELTASGAFLAQLAMGVLGVLVVTTEYSTGMIRATFAAVPQRRTVLAGKAVVFFGLTLVVGVVSSFVAFLAGQAVLGSYAGEDLGASLSDPGALRSVIGAGVFLAVMGLLGVALGAVIRASAGAVAALFGMIFFLPGVLQLLPASITDTVGAYLPSSAGSAIYRQVQQPGVLSPWVGALVLIGYALVALTVAAVLVGRRDA